jgi:hypothetical protein
MLNKARVTLIVATFLCSTAIGNAQTADMTAAHHPDMSASGMMSGAPGDTSSNTMGEAGMGKMMPSMRGMMSLMPSEHVEGAIAYRKAELAITEAQLPQWNAFADVVRANAKMMRDGMAKMMQGGMAMTAPARGEAMVQMMAIRLDSMRAVVKANGALYAILTPAQRKTANEMMMGRMGGEM